MCTFCSLSGTGAHPEHPCIYCAFDNSSILLFGRLCKHFSHASSTPEMRCEHLSHIGFGCIEHRSSITHNWVNFQLVLRLVLILLVNEESGGANG